VLARLDRVARGAKPGTRGRRPRGIAGGSRAGVWTQRRGRLHEVKRFSFVLSPDCSSISLRNLTTSGGQRLSMNASAADIRIREHVANASGKT